MPKNMNDKYRNFILFWGHTPYVEENAVYSGFKKQTNIYLQ